MQTQAITMRPEVPDDRWEVEALYDLCFAPGRSALSSYRLRDGVDPIAALCLTVRDADGILAGAIRHWPVQVAGQAVALLGPVAVHPTRQGEGLARQLVYRALEIAKGEGWDRVMLVGDEPYYGKFGFTLLGAVQMPPPTNPARVLGLALKSGAWDGVAGPVTAWLN